MFKHIYIAVAILTAVIDGYIQYTKYDDTAAWYSPREIYLGDCLLAGFLWPLYYILLFIDWRGEL